MYSVETEVDALAEVIHLRAAGPADFVGV